MRTYSTIGCLFIALAMLDPLGVHAQSDWKFWRGPNGDGSAPTATPPTEWSEDENIRWKVDLPGAGSSTPIVLGNRVFVTTAIRTDEEGGDAPGEGRRRGPQPTHVHQFVVLCYDRMSGDLLWKDVAVEAVPHEGTHGTNGFASGAPVTDGETLYVTFGSRGIFGYSLDGEKLWERDLGDMRTRNGFGEGISLNVHDGNLLVLWDHEDDSYLYNLDASSGETLWRVPRDEKTSWSTPLVVETDDMTQVIVNGSNRVISYNLENGEEIWKCGGQTGNTIPVPMLYKDMVIVMSGWRGGACYAIPLSARGDITGTEQIRWTYNYDTPYVPSPTIVDGVIFFAKNRNTILTAISADTGEPLMEATRLSELRGDIYSSFCTANGNVYMTSRSGDTLVFRFDGEMEVVSVNSVEDETDASLVFVDDMIFLRGLDKLYCIQQS